MSDDLEREVRRLREIASKQFDRLLARSPDDPVEEWARDLIALAEALRQASCSRAVLDAPVEQSTAGAAMGKSILRNAIDRMPLDDLTYHLGYHVDRFAEMKLYWFRVKKHVWAAIADVADETRKEGPTVKGVFVWDGEKYRIPGVRWEMLDYLWTHRSADADDVGKHIWGEEFDSSKISTTVNRLKNDLSASSWTVRQDRRKIVLEQKSQ